MRNVIRIIAALAAIALPAASAENTDLQSLRAQVQALEQQLKALARQIDLKEEAALAAAAAAPKITINDKGYVFASADGANSIRLRGLVHVDAREFFNDGGGITNNAFVLRRIRVITEGTLAKHFSYQFVPEFGGSAVTIHEANLSLAFSPALQLRFGRFKEPIGLERLQSDSWTFFNERSIASNLTPDRDLGVQASGEMLGRSISYAVGVFNGIADGASSTNTDFDNEKDLVGRMFVAPFKGATASALRGFSFGIAGSVGRQKTAGGRTAGYRTDGQQTFFAYNPSVVADGRTWRVAPQVEYRLGPLGALGEFIVSAVNVRPNAAGPTTELRHNAWHLAAGYVLTGEDSSSTGVIPRTNFDLDARTWGAFEIAVRHAVLDVDDAAFPLYAASAANASEARSTGVGLNWYLSKAVAFKFDYYHTKFGLHTLAPAVPVAPVLRQDENAFITRFQVTF